MNDLSITSTANQIAILQLINQFGTAVDLRDWSTFADLFADSVEFDYSSIGDVATTLTPEEIVKNARQNFGGFKATQHLITNHAIALLDRQATCHAHVRAYHVLPNDRGESTLEIGGYYEAKLIQIDSTWKIKSWKFSVLWSDGNQELFDLAKQNS